MLRLCEVLYHGDEPLEEGVDGSSLELVDLRGCEESGWDVSLGGGDGLEVDCGQISDDLYRLFRESGIRVMSNESAYSALVDSSSGRVYGGLVASFDLPDDYDEFEHGNGVVTFSVVVDPEARGQQLARRLIEDLISSNKRSLVRAQVVNPVMEKVLVGMGFERVSEEGSSAGLVYQWKRR